MICHKTRMLHPKLRGAVTDHAADNYCNIIDYNIIDHNFIDHNIIGAGGWTLT